MTTYLDTSKWPFEHVLTDMQASVPVAPRTVGFGARAKKASKTDPRISARMVKASSISFLDQQRSKDTRHFPNSFIAEIMKVVNSQNPSVASQLNCSMDEFISCGGGVVFHPGDPPTRATSTLIFSKMSKVSAS